MKSSKYKSAEFKYLKTIRSNMLQRCLNQKDPSFKFYGGRGVAIYPPWMESVDCFIEDVLKEIGHRPPQVNPRTGLSWWQFDRIDCCGDYAPGNIRWLLVPFNVGGNKRPRAVKMSSPKPRKEKSIYAGMFEEKLPWYVVNSKGSLIFNPGTLR